MPIPGPRQRVERTIEQGRADFSSASLDDKLNVDELFDLYEEVSAVYLRGLLDDEIFVDQIAPQLIVDWLSGHWLINDNRRLDDGTIDVDVYSNWQKVYRKMTKQGILHDVAEDSIPTPATTNACPTHRLGVAHPSRRSGSDAVQPSSAAMSSIFPRRSLTPRPGRCRRHGSIARKAQYPPLCLISGSGWVTVRTDPRSVGI